MDENVLNERQLDLKIYFTGIPDRTFTDIKVLMNELTSGDLIKKLSENEVNESVLNDL